MDRFTTCRFLIYTRGYKHEYADLERSKYPDNILKLPTTHCCCPRTWGEFELTCNAHRWVWSRLLAMPEAKGWAKVMSELQWGVMFSKHTLEDETHMHAHRVGFSISWQIRQVTVQALGAKSVHSDRGFQISHIWVSHAQCLINNKV